MIIDAIMQLIGGVLTGFFSLLPDATGLSFAPQATTFLAGIVGTWKALAAYPPFTALAVCVPLLILTEIAVLSFRIGTWVFHQFWGSN